MKKLTIFILVLSLLAIPTWALAGGGFDQYGYNYQARIFNGTGFSWCMAKFDDESFCNSYMDGFTNDKLIMKWNAEWDRGNDEGWANRPYDAWINNEWNGMFEGGSGSVWHYKIVWFGDCGVDGTPLPNGGYCIWGQFATLMDQGTDKTWGHSWFAQAQPNGYGFYP